MMLMRVIDDVIIDDISYAVNNDVIGNTSSVNDNYPTPSRQTRKLKPISCFTRALPTDQSLDTHYVTFVT